MRGQVNASAPALVEHGPNSGLSYGILLRCEGVEGNDGGRMMKRFARGREESPARPCLDIVRRGLVLTGHGRRQWCGAFPAYLGHDLKWNLGVENDLHRSTRRQDRGNEGG